MERSYVFAIEAINLYIGRVDDMEDLALRMSEVTLEVFCRNCIWFNIIGGFLKRMEELARNGLLGMFEGDVLNVATGLTIWVKLSINAFKNTTRLIRGWIADRSICPNLHVLVQ